MKISHRLYLTVTPAVLGVLLMVGLLYWGRYEHNAPPLVLLLGAVAVVGSVVLAWSNARFVAQRIERLASTLGSGGAAGAPDELERIARGVDRLSSDVQVAEADRADRERALEDQSRQYARLLASLAKDMAKRLEEVRLPLHILLENHFGELNENQEEMLGAARSASEMADADLVSLRQIAELDLGDHPLRRDRMKPSELIDALRPMLVAAGESVGATVDVNVAPLLPALIGDRARLQDALATMLGEIVRSSAAGANVRLTAEQRDTEVQLDVSGAGRVTPSVRLTAAERVVHVHGGTVDQHDQGLTIHLPVESKNRLSSGN
jgi:signal transduction histidine kinase